MSLNVHIIQSSLSMKMTNIPSNSFTSIPLIYFDNLNKSFEFFIRWVLLLNVGCYNQKLRRSFSIIIKKKYFSRQQNPPCSYITLNLSPPVTSRWPPITFGWPIRKHWKSTHAFQTQDFTAHQIIWFWLQAKPTITINSSVATSSGKSIGSLYRESWK